MSALVRNSGPKQPTLSQALLCTNFLLLPTVNAHRALTVGGYLRWGGTAPRPPQGACDKPTSRDCGTMQPRQQKRAVLALTLSHARMYCSAGTPTVMYQSLSLLLLLALNADAAKKEDPSECEGERSATMPQLQEPPSACVLTHAAYHNHVELTVL